MKKLLVVLFVLILGLSLLFLIGCDQDVADQDVADVNEPVETITLKFATITAEAFPYHDGATKFKELVEAKTNGQVVVEIFPGGQLGGERDINEGILEGTIHLGVGAGALAQLAPVYNIVHLPFLITGQDHMERIALGEAGGMLAAKIEEQSNLKVLGWFSTGDSFIQTVNKPITTPEDLKGQKIRIMENPALIDGLTAILADPTPMPYLEVYTGLQQGILDGAHLDLMSVKTLNIAEVINYGTDPRQAAFLAECRPVIISADFFYSLPSDIQAAIQESMLEAAAYEREVFRAKQGEVVDILLEAGITLTEIDYDAFVSRLEPVYEKWAKELGAEDIMAEILKAR